MVLLIQSQLNGGNYVFNFNVNNNLGNSQRVGITDTFEGFKERFLISNDGETMIIPRTGW